MKHKILKSIFNNKKLSIIGYTKLSHIGEDNLNKLKNFYEKEIVNNQVYFNSILSEDVDLRINHYNFIKNTLDVYLTHEFESYKLIVATFFVKAKSDTQTVGVHIDPTVVNFLDYDDFIVWIPLIDTHIKNTGRIQISPFSHITNKKINLENNKYFNYKTQNNIKVISINLKAGEPVIFFNNMSHGSEINTIYKNRPAISLKVAIKDAQIASYYVKDWDKRSVDMYLQDDKLYYMKNRWNEDKIPENGNLYRNIIAS